MGIEQIISGIVKTIDELVSEVKVQKEEDKDKVDSPLFESEQEEENNVDEAANDFAEAWDTLNKTGKDSKKEKVGSGTDCKKQISEFVSDKRDDVKEEVKDLTIDKSSKILTSRFSTDSFAGVCIAPHATMECL